MVFSFLSGFTNNDFQPQGQNAEGGVKYIKPQTACICTLNIGYSESAQKGTPAINVNFTNEAGETNQEVLYITEGGFNITKQRIASIADHAGKKEALIQATNRAFKTAQEWVDTVATVLDNVQVGVAFKGEEYVNSKAETKTKAIYWYSFAPTQDAVEVAVKYIAANPEKALKRLPTQDTTASFGATPFDVNKVDPFAANPFADSGTPEPVGAGMVLDANGKPLF